MIGDLDNNRFHFQWRSKPVGFKINIYVFLMRHNYLPI